MPWSELATPLLGVATVLLGVLAVGGHLRRQRLAQLPPDLGALVSLALCASLAVSATWALAQTLLGAFAVPGYLAALSGCFLASWASERFRGRELGIAFLLLGTALVALPLAAAVSTNGPLTARDPIDALSMFVNGSDPSVGRPLGLLLLAWMMGTWITWCALAERNAAVSCALPLVVLVANLVNMPAQLGADLFWPVLASVVLGLALLGWSQERQQSERWRALHAQVARGVPRRQRLALAGCVLVLTVAALLLPPLNRHNISGRFFHYTPQSSASTPPVGVAETGLSESVTPGPALTEDDTPVLTFSTEPADPVPYLQAEVLTGFDDGNWYPAQPLSRQYAGRQTFGYSAAALAGAGSAFAKTEALSVRYLHRGGQTINQVLYAGSPLTTGSLPGSYLVSGSYSAGALVSVTSVVPAEGIDALTHGSGELTTYGTISTASSQQLGSAGTAYPSWVRRLAALPDPGGAPELAIRRSAEAMAGGAVNPYQIAVNLASSLRQREQYTLSPPTTPAGMWPVLYFLQTSHAGYCQYFASAMGSMLRSLGIPTRLVNGFLPAGGGSAQSPEVVTQADAHTWVQVYFPTYGWVTFDPTPGDGSGVVPSIPGVTAQLPASSQPGGQGPSTQPQAAPGVTAASSGTNLGLLAVVGGALALALAIWSLWLAEVRTPAQLRRRLALVARLCTGAGTRALTMSELAALVRQVEGPSENPAFDQALGDLVELADQLSYGSGQPPGPGWHRPWRVLRGRYLRLLWRAWWRQGSKDGRMPKTVSGLR